MRSTVATVGADRRGCFSFAPSVARARDAGCTGTEGGLQGHVGKAVLRGGEGKCRGFVVATVDGFGAGVRRFGRLHRSLWGECAGFTSTTCAAGGTVGGFGAGGRRFG